MESDRYLLRNCPACGGQPDMTRAVSSQELAEKKTYAELVPHWNGFFKERAYFSYAPCAKCDLLFAPVFFTGEQLERLYAQMAPNMSEVPMEALRKTQRGYFEALKANARLEGDFIELGPDIGLFTEHCVREGHFQEYWLFEPNRQVEPTLRAVVADKPAHVVHDMFGFSSVPDGAAGAAVMIHVLDHLLDPVSTLAELRRKMTPQGRLLIVTHNESSMLRKLVSRRWPAFCLQHPQIYNPKTITTLLSKAGFAVVQQQRSVNYFQIGFLLKHLLWAFGVKVTSVPNFGNRVLGLRLGNMLTIATPKPAT
jgi:hypothetical protein